MKFEEKVRIIMNEKGMTQKELAQKSNITEASMSKYLNGARTPRIDVIINLAKALEVTTDELLDGDNDNTKINFYRAKTVLARGMDNMSDEEKLKLISFIANSMEKKK